jgi:ABC-type uncharacterized transport system permease subunit
LERRVGDVILSPITLNRLTIEKAMVISSILAILCYSLSIGLIIPCLAKEQPTYKKIALAFASLALIFHIVALQQRIFSVADGQNLSLLTIASCVSFIISFVMTIVAYSNRALILLPLVYSFSIINIALAGVMPWQVITHLEDTPTLLIHVILALFSYAMLIIALLYALQLAWINYQLKHKQLMPTDMPPLMVIERKLFHITQIGVFLLTLTLLTGLFYIDDLFSRHNAHKTVLSIIAWIVYVVLLWGHYQKGWRGTRVVWLSLAGSFLLTLGYFGSRFIQYMIYHA